MHRTTVNRWTVLILVAMFLPQSSEAQPCQMPVTRARLTVADTQTGPDTLWFGFDSTATYGIDLQLCEFEMPPLPPVGVFFAQFVNIPGREGWEPPMGLGMGVTSDFRRYVSRTQIDTHKVYLGSEYPLILRWSIAQLLAICDSARLQSQFGGFSIRMDVIDSLRIQGSLVSLLLIRYGQKLDLMSLHDKSSELPARAMLDQNYPNPFNPVTTIRYQLPTQGHVTMKVYDLLGREVVTLVEGELLAGQHEVTFDGHGLATGVYFYQLQVADPVRGGRDGFMQTKKFILLK